MVLTAALVTVVLGPLLWGRGFVLVGDMVFVPDQPWKQAWTGGDGGVPRAVPGDAWVSLVDDVVPGALLQRLLLIAVLAGAAWGISTLMRDRSTPARSAAMVLYVWNPYVYERLAIGHWALLCGYAALPYAISAGVRLRSGEEDWRRPLAVLTVALAAAGWSSPTGGVLLWGVALVLLWGAGRRWWGTLLLGAGINLPWIVPAFANQADQLAPDAFGVAAFASTSDSPLGLWGSLATFGGIWKESIVPDARSQLLFALLSLALVCLGIAGLVRQGDRTALPVRRLLALGAGSLVLAGISATTWGRPAMEWVVTDLPGGGLLRDSQKLLVPWVLAISLGFGLAVERLWDLRRRFGHHVAFWSVTVCLLPVLALPSLAWGLNGFLATVAYPDSWTALAEQVEQWEVGEDRVVVLPPSTYRKFAWNERSVLDPAPRFFPGRMVTDDSLLVPEGRVGGESQVARDVREARTPEELSEALRRHGVRWILVHGDHRDVLMPEGSALRAGGQDLSWHATENDVEASPRWDTRAVVYAWMNAGVLFGTLLCVGVSTIRRRS